MNINWKDVLNRAIKTFVEAVIVFLGTELSGMNIFTVDKVVWCAIGIAAAQAGISAVWNGVIEPIVMAALAKK